MLPPDLARRGRGSDGRHEQARRAVAEAVHDANPRVGTTASRLRGTAARAYVTGPHRAPKPSKRGQRESLKPAQKQVAPKLVPLRHGTPYCEGCRGGLKPGEQVAWWRVPYRGGIRKTVYCAACHRGRLRVPGR